MLGDHETVPGRQCPGDLVARESGSVPPVGRFERAQRLPHRKAFERAATYEGIKAKAGDTGTSGNRGSMDSSTL